MSQATQMLGQIHRAFKLLLVNFACESICARKGMNTGSAKLQPAGRICRPPQISRVFFFAPGSLPRKDGNTDNRLFQRN